MVFTSWLFGLNKSNERLLTENGNKTKHDLDFKRGCLYEIYQNIESTEHTLYYSLLRSGQA